MRSLKKKRSRKKMKYHPHGSVLFCTFSVEEGLLLLANPLCELIIQSCLVAARTLYPVKVCHIVVEATHVHMLLVVDNPDDVPNFIKHFKTESAHMINGLLGRNKRTVWCEGYDSPIVLSPLRALAAIAYMYANPAKDNLETSIDRYPGFSTWGMLRSGEHTRQWKRVRRYQFLELARDSHNLRGYTKMAEAIRGDSEEVLPFELEPNAWMEAFGYTDSQVQANINEVLIRRVRKLEERAEAIRQRDKTRVIGRERLTKQLFDLTYRPRRSGKRMWCLSEKRRERMKFISFFKELMDEARDIRERWALGEIGLSYPPGLHPPSMPKLANALYP
jgi:hypothetical protein